MTALMVSREDVTLDDVDFAELESVDQYEATFTGTVGGEEITLTYVMESAVGTDEEVTVFTPGDDELEQVVVQPDAYEFETDARDTVRFAAADDEGQDLFLIYVFSEAEDSDENTVGLDVESGS